MAKFRAYQIGLTEKFQLDIGKLLPKGHIAFFVEECVWQLNTSEIEKQYSELGASGLHPKLLLSLLFLGYIYGIRSGRKLAQACAENIAFIYISKQEFPKKTVINSFRTINVEYFDSYFKQVLHLFKQKQRDASLIIFDGSKIGANASKWQTRTKETYEKWLGHLSDDIAAIKAELEQAELEQTSQESVALEKTLVKKEALVEKIHLAIAPLTNPKDKVNLTDTDAVKMKGKKGNVSTFYNVQVSCTTNQVILYADVNKDHNDKQQLIPCVVGTQQNTNQKIKQAVADPGYASYDNYEYLEKEKIIGYIPDQDFNKEFKDQPYHKSHFLKDPQKDQLICPQGQLLPFSCIKNDRNNKSKLYKGIACETCPVKKECTKAKARTVLIEIREPLRDQMRERLNSEQGQQIYKKRLHPVEAIFGHLKFNFGFTYFLLRGLPNVKAEFKLMCIAYNLKKLATFSPFFLLSWLCRSLRAQLFYLSKFVNELFEDINKNHYTNYVL